MSSFFRTRITKSSPAFTFVELSMVMVIIGLLIGSIVVGGNMMANARVIAVAAEVQQYLGAINSFQNQYDALPGDITNASIYWPSCTSASGDSGNCNGNGDGVIGNKGTIWWSGSSYNSNEFLRAWQHMSLAGMIPGNYSGFGASSTNGTSVGVNSPASRYPNGVYSFWADSCYGYKAYSILILAAITGGTLLSGTNFSPIAASGVMTTADSYNFDLKIDDGLPMTGSVIARDGYGTANCTATSSSTACAQATVGNAAYNTYMLQNTKVGCQVGIFYQTNVTGLY